MRLLKMFFGKIFWLGLIVILLSCIVDMKWGGTFWVSIIVNCASTVGIAVMLGAIFDFSRNSEEFIGFMSDIIKRTMITKDFLEELTDEEKKNVLETVVIPSNSYLKKYSSINNYYQKAIDAFVDLGKTPFKTNLTINIIAKIENNTVVCEGNVSYRRYRVGDKYKPIITTFERTDSAMQNNYILLPDGTRYDLKPSEDVEVIEQDELQQEKILKKFITNVPDEYNEFPYITICREIKEVGCDHWINFNWSSLTACDGICFELHCLDGLIIKEHKVFDNPKLYEINLNTQEDKINIVSTSWLNEYTGFSVIVAKK